MLWLARYARTWCTESVCGAIVGAALHGLSDGFFNSSSPVLNFEPPKHTWIFPQTFRITNILDTQYVRLVKHLKNINQNQKRYTTTLRARIQLLFIKNLKIHYSINNELATLTMLMFGWTNPTHKDLIYLKGITLDNIYAMILRVLEKMLIFLFSPFFSKAFSVLTFSKTELGLCC